MSAYYNENDPFAAAWLRNLIAAGLVPAGDVDERSIVDVGADDVRGYVQCHFFAGIGGWPYALRLAGWPDDRPVFTGSCPCQPLSSAGQRQGHADERHLWPAFQRLIALCRPATVFGEQVASKDGREWLSGVRADLEHLGYAVGAADLSAAGVGAPHIRQRLFWVANTDSRDATQERAGNGSLSKQRAQERWRTEQLTRPGAASRNGSGHLAEGNGGVADAGHDDGTAWAARSQHQSEASVGTEHRGDSGVGDSANNGRSRGGQPQHGDEQSARGVQPDRSSARGFWDGAVWLPCLDGKARRTEPKYVEISDGLPGNMGLGSSKEKIDGTQGEGGFGKDLCGMRKADGAQAVQRNAGSESELQPPEVLRPEMHGAGTSERRLPESEPQPGESVAFDESGLRGLRSERWPVARSSSGQEPAQQRPIELADFVQLLPSSLALAQLSGDTATETALLALLQACDAERLVCYPPDSIEEAWRSLPGETRERFGHLVRQGQWLRTFESPLAVNPPARVGRLRGYGNAVVPQAAAAFVEAFLAID